MIGDPAPARIGNGEMARPFRRSPELSKDLQMVVSEPVNLRIPKAPFPFFPFQIEPAGILRPGIVETDPVDSRRLHRLQRGIIRKDMNPERRIRRVTLPVFRPGDPGNNHLRRRRYRTPVFLHTQLQTELPERSSGKQRIGERSGRPLRRQGNRRKRLLLPVQIHDFSAQHAARTVSRDRIADSRSFIFELNTAGLCFRLRKSKRNFTFACRKIFRAPGRRGADSVKRKFSASENPEHHGERIRRNPEIQMHSFPFSVRGNGKRSKSFPLAPDLRPELPPSPAGERKTMQPGRIRNVERLAAQPDLSVVPGAQDQRSLSRRPPKIRRRFHAPVRITAHPIPAGRKTQRKPAAAENIRQCGGWTAELRGSSVKFFQLQCHKIQIPRAVQIQKKTDGKRRIKSLCLEINRLRCPGIRPLQSPRSKRGIRRRKKAETQFDRSSGPVPEICRQPVCPVRTNPRKRRQKLRRSRFHLQTQKMLRPAIDDFRSRPSRIPVGIVLTPRRGKNSAEHPLPLSGTVFGIHKKDRLKNRSRGGVRGFDLRRCQLLQQNFLKIQLADAVQSQEKPRGIHISAFQTENPRKRFPAPRRRNMNRSGCPVRCRNHSECKRRIL